MGGSAGADGVAVLYNTVQEVDAQTTETTLLEYLMPADTLAGNGDYILINALCENKGALKDRKTMKLYFGNLVTPILTQNTNDQQYIEMTVKISRVTSSSQFQQAKIEISGSPTDSFNSYSSNTVDLTTLQRIRLTGQVTSTTGDLISKILTVTYHKKS